MTAAAAGRVILAGDVGRKWCGGRRVAEALLVQIDHGVQADGATYRTAYLHLSAVDVHVGDLVAAGQRLGLSGSTGCSSGPHLHLSVYRQAPGDAAPALVDPYGWTGGGRGSARRREPGVVGPRPRPSARPPLARRGAGHRGGLARMTGTDPADPVGGEWVDVAVWPKSPGPVALGGFVLEDVGGARFPLPDLTVAPGSYVRVWTGAPRAVEVPAPAGRLAASVGWGRAAEVWDDTGDCALLFDPGGHVVSTLAFGPVDRAGCVSAVEPSEEE